MKTILFFLSFGIACFAVAQSPSTPARQSRPVPASLKTVATTPPINKIVVSPKEVNKKKRKPVPVTVAGKNRPAQVISRTN